MVMVLIPIFSFGVYPLAGQWVRVTPLRRMSVGMVLAGFSFVAAAMIQSALDHGARVNIGWQFVPYLILTSAEVMISITGLEFAYTQAPRAMKSTIMSFWLLTVAFGNLMVSWITKLAPGGGDHSSAVSSGRFLFYAVLTLVVAAGFVVASMLYRYRNPANAAGTPRAE